MSKTSFPIKKKNPVAEELLDRKGPFKLRIFKDKREDPPKITPKNYEEFIDED
jgi:hypothetical protein